MDLLVFSSDNLPWISIRLGVGKVWCVVGVVLNSRWNDGLDEAFLSGVDRALFVFFKEGLEWIA